MSSHRRLVWFTLGLLAAFFAWRMVRPLHIFAVADRFALPVAVAALPAPLASLSAEGCVGCHPAIADEWRTSVHRQAWDDPYYQVDRRFDGDPQVCLNCHTPFAAQQRERVLGFRDRARWQPLLAPNPDFDAALQHEGVTCLACHLDVASGALLGPHGDSGAPHPTRRMADPNQVCFRCHVVDNRGWDTHFRIPPCGTVAEIEQAGALPDCVACHMESVARPAAQGSPVRTGHRHLWRGGHDPATVAAAVRVEVAERPPPAPGERSFALTLTNTGAAHALPTGTPDRHLTATFRLLDRAGREVGEQSHRLRRAILWRPFIVDLWDTRLVRDRPRTFVFRVPATSSNPPATLEVVVRYHLLDERRRLRIGYANRAPIAYDLFRRRIDLGAGPPAG